MNKQRWKCFKVKGIRRVRMGRSGHQLLWKLPDGRWVRFDQLPVGAMWHTNDLPDDYDAKKRYKGDKASICVVVPGKSIWHMHHLGTDGTSKWTVEGEIPNVTAKPSINFIGRYHGYVDEGYVSDDYEGREFSDEGFLIKGKII